MKLLLQCSQVIPEVNRRECYFSITSLSVTALRSTSSTTSHRDVPLHNDELLPDMSLTPQPPAFARMMPPPQKLLSLEEQAAQAQQQHMSKLLFKFLILLLYLERVVTSDTILERIKHVYITELFGEDW